MRAYDLKILNRLLDQYEKSTLSTGENRRTVHIDLPFTQKVIPEYFDTSSTEYENIHSILVELEQCGLIRIFWKDGKKGHVIEKVRLLTEDNQLPSAAYAYVKRIPKTDLETSMMECLEEFVRETAPYGDCPVSLSFAKYLLERVKRHAGIREYCSLQDLTGTRRFLETVRCVETNPAPCYIREFSIINFHDSKFFEQTLQKTAGVFRRFHAGYENLDEREILAEYGIYHTHNYVYFKGAAAMKIGSRSVSLTALSQGIGLSGDDLEKLEIAADGTVRSIITIENLTTFFRWQEKDALLIYLGGYHNGVRRTLLQKLHRIFPDAQYLHFGDIDAGGFLVFEDLRAKTGIPFAPLHMDLETLKKTNQHLIDTLEEVKKIQDDGRARRAEAEIELGRIEGELKQKLLDMTG